MLPTSTRVVQAVARSIDVPVESLPPLYDAIDPDALDSLFARHDGRSDDGQVGTVTFSFAGCEVTVRPDDVVIEGSTSS